MKYIFALFIPLLILSCKSSPPNVQFGKDRILVNDATCAPASTFTEAIHQGDFETAQQLTTSTAESEIIAFCQQVVYRQEGVHAPADFPPTWQSTAYQLAQAQAWENGRFQLLSTLIEAGQSVYPDEESAAIAAGFAKLASTPSFSFPQTGFTVPLHLNGSHNPLVEIQVNGHTYRFWLDTGAAVNVISSKVAEKCGVALIDHPAVPIGTSTDKEVLGQIASIDTLSMGELQACHLPCLVLDHKDLSFRLFGIPLFKVDGILGWPLIRELNLAFDFPAETLRVSPSRDVPHSAANLGWYWQPFLRLQGKSGCPIHLYLDTGSATTFFYPSAYPKMGIVPGRQSKTLMAGAGGNAMMKVDQLDSCQILVDSQLVTLGYAEGMIPSTSDDSLFQFDGVIGQDILSKGIFKLDGKARFYKFQVPN